MPNFTPPETDIEDLPSLPESEAPVQPSTEIVPYTESDGILVKLNPMVEAIQKYRALKATDLVTTGMTKKQIRDIAHEKTMEGTRIRTEIDRVGKVLKEDALRIQRTVNSEKNKRIGEVEPIEEGWRAMRDAIDREAENERLAKQQAIEAMIATRIQQLSAFGVSVQVSFYKGEHWANLQPGAGSGLTIQHLSVFEGVGLASMSDSMFSAHVTGIKAVYDAAQAEAATRAEELARLQAAEAERQRLAAEAEAKARAIEAERLETQRLAQEAERQRLDAEAARVRAEQAEAQRKLDEQAAAQRAEAERMERAAKALKDGLRMQRDAALSAVNGLHPITQDSDPIDLADMEVAEWSEYLAGQTQLFNERKAREAREAEAAEARRREAAAAEAEHQRLAQEAELAAAQAKAEALKPDIEKLKAYGEKIMAAMDPAPEVETTEAKNKRDALLQSITRAVAEMNAA